MKGYRQVLSVHFVYGKQDAKFLAPYIDELKCALTRNADYPISHRLDIPTFIWTYDNFIKRKAITAERSIYFFFVGKNVMAGKERQLLENMTFRKREQPFIIALDNKAFDVGGAFAGLNQLRFFEWKKCNLCAKGKISWQKNMLVLNVAKNIYQVLQGKKKKQLSLFLSHAKADKTALETAQDIKRFLENKTTIKNFFDANCIEDGENFEKKITKGLSDSAVVCIHSKHYADSIWCSKEVIISKKNNLPMLAVDCSGGFIDRISPYAANVPCVCPTSGHKDEPLQKVDVLSTVRAMMVEAVRFRYISAKFSLLKKAGEISKSSILLSRAPEPLDVLNNVCSKKKVIFYPEPPLASVERLLYEDNGFKLRTITSSPDMYGVFKGLSVGISVSDVSGEGEDSLDLIGKTSSEIKNLVVDLSRSLLFREAELIYGGDIQSRVGNNFTKLMVEEWHQLSKKYGMKLPKIKNYVAWTLRNMPGQKDKGFMSDYQGAVEKCLIELPDNVAVKTKKAEGVYPCDIGDDFYVWSRALTRMREVSILRSDARICAGGKCYGAKGRMPGVLEEILLSIRYDKPLYLIGGFGGISAAAASLLLGEKVNSDALTMTGQCKYSPKYALYLKTLERMCETNGFEKEVRSVIAPKLLRKLSKNAGLTQSEYRHLLITPFAEDCVRLILKGIEKRFSTKSKPGSHK